MKRALAAAILPALLVGGCASDGTATGPSAAWYSDYYDPWYWAGGGWVYPPDFVGPPHPEHPIVLPPGSTPRPEHPVATPPSSAPRPSQPIATPPSRPSAAPRPMPMPRPAMRGGGGRR
jgi:hypothetical protein